MSNRRKVGTTSSHHGLYVQGCTRHTMRRTKGSKPARPEGLADADAASHASASRGKPEDASAVSFRKEVIQPQVPLRLPCYDLVPITKFALGTCLLSVSTATSGTPRFRGLTGGVYKAQEHIHRGMLTRDY